MIFHLWLVSHGYTTIDFCEKRMNNTKSFSKSPYDLGIWRNFQTVLGPNAWLWLIPIYPNHEGLGIYFEVREDLKNFYENKY